MAFELAAYAVTAGLMHRILPRKKPCVYLSLLTAMAAGRIVWGIAAWIALGMSGGSFTLTAFLSGAVINALPGIAVQIAVIPILVMILDKEKL
jgi:hypothetical protein